MSSDLTPDTSRAALDALANAVLGLYLESPGSDAVRTLSRAAATLRAGPVGRFFSVALPLARPGLLSASVLGFAHTVGEFGVVLMIGGNIPGETRVLSVAVFEHVEALEFADAHRLAGGMVVFALAVLLALTLANRRAGRVLAGT